MKRCKDCGKGLREDNESGLCSNCWNNRRDVAERKKGIDLQCDVCGYHEIRWSTNYVCKKCGSLMKKIGGEK